MHPKGSGGGEGNAENTLSRYAESDRGILGESCPHGLRTHWWKTLVLEWWKERGMLLFRKKKKKKEIVNEWYLEYKMWILNNYGQEGITSIGVAGFPTHSWTLHSSVQKRLSCWDFSEDNLWYSEVSEYGWSIFRAMRGFLMCSSV